MWRTIAGMGDVGDATLESVVKMLPARTFDEDARILARIGTQQAPSNEASLDSRLHVVTTCADDKQKLTGEIVAARRRAREARNAAASAKAITESVPAVELPAVERGQEVLAHCAGNITEHFSALANAVAAWEQAVPDALTKLRAVEADAATYAAAASGTPADVTKLRPAVGAIAAQVEALRDDCATGMSGLVDLKVNLLISLDSSRSFLDTAKSTLTDLVTSSDKIVTEQTAAVEKDEGEEKRLMEARDGVDEVCDQFMLNATHMTEEFVQRTEASLGAMA